MKKNILYIGILASSLLAACSREEIVSPGIDDGRDPGEIRFTGAVQKQHEGMTRAETINPDDYEMLNAAIHTGFGTFYIWQEVKGEEDESTSYFQPYKIVPGEQGSLQLDNKNDIVEDLNWMDKTSKHTFYAWTQPSLEGEESSRGLEMDTDYSFGVQSIEDDTNDKISGTVHYGTAKDLEYFIVTQNGPISYQESGEEVGLYFKHPISKIQLERVQRIAGGTFSDVYGCTITFPNFVKTATFNPLAKEGEWLTPVEGEKGVEWVWDRGSDPNNLHPGDPLYVHPFDLKASTGTNGNVDIHKDPGFFIIETETNTYTGSLNLLTWTEHGNKLQPGECMKLELTINDSGGVGGRYLMVPWNTEGVNTIPQYRIPGVYNEEDAKRLLEALKNPGGKDLEELIPDLIVKEGGDKITINLFTHVNWSELKENITIPEGYTLNGNGFNLSWPNNYTLSGSLKDIYINDKVYTEESEGSDSSGTSSF